MRVKLDDLEAFVAIADHGSFGRAAESLNITQSALSRRIKKLESVLGATVLDRTSRHVTVSILGQEFLPEARRIVEEVSRSIKDIGDLVEVRKGSVSIASNMTLADTLLPEILRRFRADNPNVRVRVTESSSPNAVFRVLNRECEFAISQFGEGHPDLEFEPLIEDEFILICHRDHPLASKPDLVWSDLETHNFIRMRPSSGTTGLLERTLGDQIRYLSGDIEVGHFNALLACVGANLGVSAVPTLVRLKRTDLNLVTRPISSPKVSRYLGIIKQKDRSLSPAAAVLTDICRTVVLSAKTSAQSPS